MPSEGRRLHGFTVVSRALTLGRQFLLPAILGGASVGDEATQIIRWTLIILAVPSLGVAVAQWLAFRFRLEDDELIIDSGVLSRRRRVIPLARVQNVDLEQSFLERLVGVGTLRLETASGGSETEGSLAVLALDEARTLQAELLRRRAGLVDQGQEEALYGAGGSTGPGDASAAMGARQGTAPHGTDSEEEILRLSLVDLVIAGATSNEAGLIAAGLATGIEILDDTGRLSFLDTWAEQVFQEGAALGLSGILLFGAGLVLAFVVLGWLLSIVATSIRYYGFTLTRSGTDLRREYGLFSRHHTTVPLERVQAVRIEETILRRAFGLAALKVETAGAAPGRQPGQRSRGGAEAYVPIARRRDVGRLLRTVFPDAPFDDVTLHSVSPISRRRSFFRLALPIAVGTAIATALDPRGPALLALLVPAWFLARAQYRARGWARPRPYAILRGGVFTRSSWVIPERKIQTLHTQANPFQRRWKVATLVVDTAGGGQVARVPDLTRRAAREVILGLARDSETERRRALEAG